MNSVGKESRQTRQVHKHWYYLSKDIKKKEASRRREFKLTGNKDEPSELTPSEEKVTSIPGDEAIEGIVGGLDTIEDAKHESDKSDTNVMHHDVLR